MSKPLIVIADTDENYLEKLEYKFLEMLDERIMLEIISEEAYFNSFFSTPKTAEIVVVDEKLYSRELQKHNIANLFVLTEELAEGNTEELNIARIYKFSGMKEIFNELIYRSKDKLLGDVKEHEETRVIAFYSAIGGSGKTCLGLGLAESLVMQHQKVLYVNTETVQDFAVYLMNQSGMPNEGIRALRENKAHLYKNVRHFIRKEGFFYIPPFSATLDSLNLDYSVFRHIIEGAKESREYDFIIVDVEAGYGSAKMELLQFADKIVMVTLQDAVSLFKTEYILQNIDWQDGERYLFVCNKYQEDAENVFLSSDAPQKLQIKEYIENVNKEIKSIQQISQMNSIQKLAYRFL